MYFLKILSLASKHPEMLLFLSFPGDPENKLKLFQNGPLTKQASEQFSAVFSIFPRFDRHVLYTHAEPSVV